MKDLVRSRGLQDYFLIDSAAVTTEEIGNAIYPPAKRKLYEKGIPFDDHRARLITKKEIEDYYADFKEHRLTPELIEEDEKREMEQTNGLHR